VFLVLCICNSGIGSRVVVGASDIQGSGVADHHGQELLQAGASPRYVVPLSLSAEFLSFTGLLRFSVTRL
jgi:hypothetical protein